MLDPSLTNVLRRRVLASLVDLAVLGAIGLVAARFLAEKFIVSARDDRGAVFATVEEFERLQEMDASWYVYKAEFGDTWYVIDGPILLMVLAIVGFFGFLLLAVLPSKTDATIGKRLLGLRVTDLLGERAALSQHITRFVFGAVDLLPIVLPGLLGWILASMSTHTQRLGDRMAQTAVIGANEPVTLLDGRTPRPETTSVLESPKKAKRGRGSKKKADGKTDKKSEDGTIDLDARLGAAPSPAGDAVSDATPAAGEPIPTALSGAAESVADRVPSPLTRATAEVPAPTPSVETEAHPPPEEPVDVPADSGVLEQPTTTPADAVPESDEMFKTSRPPVGTGAPAEASLPSDADRALPPPPRHRSDREWEPPIAEPAPVWEPPLPQHRAATAPETAAPEPLADEPAATESAPDESAPAEPTTTEPAATEPVTTAATDPSADSGAPTTAAATDPSADSGAPVAGSTQNPLLPQWSDEWKSWLYFDPERQTWLRHDTTVDEWIPLG